MLLSRQTHSDTVLYCLDMNRFVNRKHIDAWIFDNYPSGLDKLSRAAKVPSSYMVKIRNGQVPRDKKRRQRLAKVLGVDEFELFPNIEAKVS